MVMMKADDQSGLDHEQGECDHEQGGRDQGGHDDHGGSSQFIDSSIGLTISQHRTVLL